MHAQRDTARAAAQQATTQDSRPVHPRGAAARMQRRYGNRRTQAVIQAKLTVGRVDDPLEREADRISGLAMRQPVQRALQSAQFAPESVGHVHGAEGGVADTAVAGAIARASGGGQAVPDGVRERMERVSGADFSGVRVHVDAEADRLNDALGSRAFTVGSNVFVRRSEYRPGSTQGDALLAHELTHTVQQGAAGPCSEPASAAFPAVAQRKFGFELELHDVPVFSRQDGVEGKPQKSADETIARGRNIEAHVDGASGLNAVVPAAITGGPDGNAPILELVTRPMDEFTESETRVRSVMNDLVQVARHIENNALNANTNVALDGLPGLRANPRDVNFVGYPTGAGGLGTLTAANAHMQATYGLSVKRVSAEFNARAGQAPNNLQPGHYYELYKAQLVPAITCADGIVQWVRDTFGDQYGGTAALAEAHGLFTLMASYLLVGKFKSWAQLHKNQAGIFFYKTRLSTVRNQIVASYPRLGALFEERQDELLDKLLARTGRVMTHPIFPGMVDNFNIEVMSGIWIMNVLKGSSDDVYDNAANMTDELHNSRIGRGAARGSGVIVENRRFAQTDGHDYSHTYRPDEWPDLAAGLRQHLRDLQGYADGEGSLIRRLINRW